MENQTTSWKENGKTRRITDEQLGTWRLPVYTLDGVEYVSVTDAVADGYNCDDLTSIYVQIWPIVDGKIFRAPQRDEEDREARTFKIEEWYVNIATWRTHLMNLWLNKKLPRNKGHRTPAAPKTPKRTYRTYVIEAAGTGMVKIGRAADCVARLAQLQTGSFAPLTLLADIEQDIEGKLHRLFKSSHSRGEWFNYTDEIKQYLATI